MRSRMFVLVGVMIICLGPLYGTDVSGNQSGIWTLAESPYNVIGNVTVPSGEYLEIEPGVQIQVMGDYRITVEGVIEATGTETDSIRFYAEGLRWDTIRLENEIEESTFTHCLIANADTGISSIQSPVTVSECRFDDNITGIRVNGIGATNPPEVNILYTRIENSQQNGIFIVQNSNTLIDNCEITTSALSGQARGAIQLSNQSASGHNNPTISNNHIHHNTWQGITAWDLTGTSRINPTVVNNLIEYNLTGIYLIHSSGFFFNNIVQNNYVTGNPDSGAGVMISGSSALPLFTENVFTGNYTGFYIVTGGSANLGTIDSPDPDAYGMNQIYGNVAPDGNTNSVYNLSSADIMAQNNIWDSEDYDEIADTIFDGNDNADYGFVIFDPIYQPEEASISGSVEYLGEMEIVAYRVILYHIETETEIAETLIDDTGEFTLSIEEFGDFYLYAYGIPLYDNEAVPMGAYECTHEPVSITLEAGDHLTGYQIGIFDEREPHHYRIDGIINEHDPELFIMNKTRFVFPVEVTELLYEEDDWLRIWAYLIHDQQSGVTDSLFVTESSALIKQQEVEFGESWLYPHYDVQTGEIVYLEAEVTDLQEYDVTSRQNTVIEITISEPTTDEVLQVWWVENNMGIIKIQTYQDYAILNDLFISVMNITGGSGFFPLEIENSWSYGNFIPGLVPTNLRYQLENEDHIILKWDAPRQNPQENWTGYNIYRNGIVEHSIDFGNPVYHIPVPTENSTYTITVFNDQGESPHSNQIEITVTGVGDQHSEINLRPDFQLYPNPISISSSREMDLNLSLQLPEDMEIELSVYNIRGQKVATVHNGFMESGIQLLNWSPLNEQKRPVSNGIYFFRLKTPKTTLIRKFTIIN